MADVNSQCECPVNGRFPDFVVSNSFHCRAVGPHPTAPIYTDFGRKHRPKSVLAKPQRFVTDFDAAFVRQVFDIPERKQKTD